MTYREEDYLQLSGLQHFQFCRRQWALIHIENQWAENFRTTDGGFFHANAHDAGFRELRGDTLMVRGLSVSSRAMGVSGQCDVVEFHRDPAGVPLAGYEGTWRPFPIEYKRGSPNQWGADELQLCAQAMCLEEMLCCDVPEGALFYGEPHRRTGVAFTPELRQEVRADFEEMHRLYQRGRTLRVKPTKSCNACSLKELCLPVLMKTQSVSSYLRAHIGEDRA